MTAVRPVSDGMPRRLLSVLRIAVLLGGVGQASGGAAGGLLARQLSGSDAVAGLPQAALTAGAALAALAVSRIAARTTRRRSLSLALVAGAVGAGLCAMAAAVDSLAVLVAGSAVFGAGNAAVMLARYAATDLVAPDARGRAIGTVLAATSVGAAAGPNLLAPTAPLAHALALPGLAGPYLAAVLAYVVAAGILTGLLRPDPLTLARAPIRRSTLSLGDVLRRRDAGVGVVVLATANLVMVAVMTMAPLQMRAMGGGLRLIGLVVSLHIAAMFAPAPLSGRLVDRWGTARAVTLAGWLFVAATAFAYLGASRMPVLVAAAVLLGAAWNVAVVAGSAALAGAAPAADRPRLEAVGELGMGAAAAVGGAASGAAMAGWSFAGLALAGLAAALPLVAAGARRPRVLSRPGTAAPSRSAR